MAQRCFYIATSWQDQVIPSQFKALARELVARGHRVVVLVDGRRVDAEDHASNPAIYTWPNKRPTGREDAAFLRSLVRRDRPDCLIANFGATNVMILVGRLLGVPARVAWYHTLSGQTDADSPYPVWQARWLHLRKRGVHRMATHLVANSEAGRRDLYQTYGEPPERVTIWPYFLPDPLAGQSPRPKANATPRLVVCAGRLFASKGQDVLLRAMPQVFERAGAVRLELLGDGPERLALERLAADLGVSEWCDFRGQASRATVLERMAAADVVVVPSRDEAFGIVNVESLAVGTPVVASRVGGISEIVRDGRDGFLVAPDDPAALADRLSMLLCDANLRRTMAGSARRRFVDTYELETNIPRLAEWCEDLVVERAPREGRGRHVWEKER
jgi:glycosyltransferase involved in cell wall biosynthesis